MLAKLHCLVTDIGGIEDIKTHPVSDLPNSPARIETSNMDWLMSASPGTAIKSVLDASGSPGKMMSRYLATFSGAGLEVSAIPDPTSVDSPHNSQDESDQWEDKVSMGTQFDDPLFSPGSLSTPFRNAIFAQAISPIRYPSLPVPRSAERNGLQLSSEDLIATADSTDLQINLLPPTADRRFALHAAQSRNAQDNGKVLDSANNSLTLLDEFSTFLLKTSSSLSSPSPPRCIGAKTTSPSFSGIGKRSLLPLQMQKQRSALSILSSGTSSDFDVEPPLDMLDLPPSSPPPLPSSSTARGLMNSFLGQLVSPGTAFEDGQSPISVTTTATNEGTPPEAPSNDRPSHTASNTVPHMPAERYEYFWLDSDLSMGQSNDSIDLETGKDNGNEDPLLSFFSSTSSFNKNHIFSSSSSTGMTYSDSTASSSSLASFNISDPRNMATRMHQQHKLTFSDD